MGSIRRPAAVAVAVLLTATATVLVTRHLNQRENSRSWEDSTALAAAVRSDIVRTEDGRAELAAASGDPDAIRLIGAEALSQVVNEGHRSPPTLIALQRAAQAEVRAGVSAVLVSESVASSAAALQLREPITLGLGKTLTLPESAAASASAEGIRAWAANEELAGRSAQLCHVARSLVSRSLLRALLAWPLRGCTATPAEASAVLRDYASLGEDGGAIRSIAAAFRITQNVTYKRLLQQRVVELESNTFPNYLTPDTADSLVLSALSGVRPPRSASVDNYIFQQRMTSGALAEAGQESGESVGYAAELVRDVLRRQPMLADPVTKLRGATDIVVAGPAAYETAMVGHRDAAALQVAASSVHERLMSYPGIIGLFLGGDCPAVRAAAQRWSDTVQSANMPGAIEQDPSLGVLLVTDAQVIGGCKDVASGHSNAVNRVTAYANTLVTRGAGPAGSLEATWAATRVACLQHDLKRARRVVASSGFEVDSALVRAKSTDDLYFIARLARVHDGSCATGIPPW